MLPVLTIDQIVDAVVDAFNTTGFRYPGTLNKIIIAGERLKSGDTLFSEVRPYSTARDIAIHLAHAFVADDIEKINASFPGQYPADDAVKRAARNIKSGHPTYVQLNDKIIKALLPPDLRRDFLAVQPAPAKPQAQQSSPTHIAPLRNGHGKITTPSLTRRSDIIAAAEHAKSPHAIPAVPKLILEEQLALPKLPLSIKGIKAAVVEAWQIHVNAALTVDDIDSNARNRTITRPRQISMYACSRILDRNIGSLPSIGKHHGERDHTTVIHAINIIRNQILAGDKMVGDILRYVAARVECSELAGLALMNPDMPYGSPRRTMPTATTTTFSFISGHTYDAPAPLAKTSHIPAATIAAWNALHPTRTTTEEWLTSRSSARHLALLRRVGMYTSFVFQGEDRSVSALAAIGKSFGRDSTTAFYAIKEVAAQVRLKDEMTLQLLKTISEHADCTPQQASRLFHPSLDDKREDDTLKPRPALRTPTGP